MPRPPSIIREMRSIRLLISLFQQIRIKHLRSLYQLVCIAADSFTSFANQMTHRLHHIRHRNHRLLPGSQGVTTAITS